MAVDSREGLQQLLVEQGGSASFSLVMDWLLNNPEHGFYGSGRCCFGSRGDFVTAPYLGSALADHLLKQLLPCFDLLAEQPGTLSLIEWGPGDGLFAQQLAHGFVAANPPWLPRLEILLLELNAPLRQRQQQTLQHCPIRCHWPELQQLQQTPRRAVVVAHELLDALPVDRFVLHQGRWHGLEVGLNAEADFQWQRGAVLQPKIQCQLASLGLAMDGGGRPEGWCSEWCSSLEPWLQLVRQSIDEGWLLAIDYGHPAQRYYSPHRDGGTLLAYRGQLASPELLAEPGSWDITAHVCTTLLEQLAPGSGWNWLGSVLQGEALLRLGLGTCWAELSAPGAESLSWRLARREEYQRLTDPYQLGGFWWLQLGTPGLPSMEELVASRS